MNGLDTILKNRRRGKLAPWTDRSLVNAIFYVVRAGCAWRLLPVDFGPWQMVYGCYRRWVKQLRPFGKLRLEIVRRCNHAKGFKVLPRRWIVERTFGWLYKPRRLRDYEVRPDHSAAMIRICMIRIMLRRLARAA